MFIYDHEDLSFRLFIPDYWVKIYKGKPRNKLYYDYRVMLDLVKKVDRKKIILDVGANNGLFCVPASMMGYTVVGFEPVKINVDNLEKAQSANRLENFHLYHLALSNENGERDIYIPECHDNASFSKDAAVANMKNKGYQTETVDTVRFDDWIKEHPEYSDIGFIKIDAQGSEYDIVTGMKEFLSNATNISILCEYEDHLLRMGHSYSELDQLFESCGFLNMGKHVGNDKLFLK